MSPRAHQQALTGPPGGDHGGEVRRGADLLIVIPAGDVQHGNVDLADAVLVAKRLPPLVEGAVPQLLTPVRRDEPGRIHRRQRAVAVHGHPVDIVTELRHPAIDEPVPVDVHRAGQPGRDLHERIAGGHQAHHRP